MWEVWYSLEATNYLADNGQLVADLFFKMESLAEREGWPKVGSYESENDLIFWQIARHKMIHRLSPWSPPERISDRGPTIHY